MHTQCNQCMLVALCGVCEHMYICTMYSTGIYSTHALTHYLLSVVPVRTCTQVWYTTGMHSTSTQVLTLSHTHLLQTDPTLSRQILELSIHSGDLDFIKYLVNKLSVDVDGELSNTKSVIHT